MKNLSVIINVVLAIAIAVLYYLHFSCSSQCQVADEEINSQEQDSVDVKHDGEESINSNIGYINIDSLQDKYALYEELIQKLKSKQTKYEREISTKMTAFEKKVQEFQKQAATMSQFEGKMKQQELAEEEQKLYKLREDYSVRFQKEEIKLNEEFQKTVSEYIKKHNKETDFDIIIGASQMGSMVLDFKNGIDITDNVVEGLNSEYQTQNDIK